jgi:hypothetical protein
VDGGMRTGIDIDGEPAWQVFREPRANEPDAALLWYVDVRCKGGGIPKDREAARSWLTRNATPIKSALQSLADKLRVGYDDESWPYQHTVRGGPSNTSIRIVCSSVRGLEIGELSKSLRELGDNWEGILDSLEPAEAISA